MKQPGPRKPLGGIFDVMMITWCVITVMMMPSDFILPVMGKATYAFKEVLILLLAISYLKYRKYSITQSFRWRIIHPRTWSPTLLLAASAAVLLDAIDRLVSLVIPLPESQSELLQTSFTGNAPGETFWIFVGVAIVAPLVEESIFRGFIQRIFEQRMDITKAVLMSALIFGLIHMQPWWLIQLLIMSVLLGYLAWRSNSLVPCIVVHAFVNGLTLILFNFAPGGLIDVYLWHNQVNPFVTLAALALFIRAFRIWEQSLKG